MRETEPKFAAPGAGRQPLGLGYLCGAPRVSTHPEAEASGARAHVCGVIDALRGHGCAVTPYLVGDQVPVDWVRPGSHKSISSSWPRRMAADVVRLLLARKHSRRAFAQLRGGVDVVYERFGAFQSMGRPFQRTGTPWVLETNGAQFLEARSQRKSMALASLARRYELRAYRDCDLLVCISEDLKRVICRHVTLDPQKILVLSNGVDTGRFDPAGVTPKRAFEGFTIGFVGNMYAWAGLKELLSVVAGLRREGLDLHVSLIGDGMERRALEEQVRGLNLADHVRFLGRVGWDEVPAYLGGFDVAYSGQVRFLEGQMYCSPLKLYEYMAMGRPVIASAFQDARALIEDGRDGFLFDPDKAGDLKAAIVRAHEGRDELAAMGRLARERIVAGHSWQARVATLLKRMAPLVGRSPAEAGGAGSPQASAAVTGAGA